MNNQDYTFPIPVTHYMISDPFWSEKMELVRTKMIPYQWRALNDCQEGAPPSHCIENFKIAAGISQGAFQGNVFQDSDLAKWLEAVGYSLAWHKDSKLESLADGAIDLIVKAQQPDGYLDTYYIINGLERAWTNIADNHELYCAGHMIEAAVAYYIGTGKRKFLDAVIRLADCIDNHFGSETGKLHGYPGHEILEMALVRLYHVTGTKKYLSLAEYFVNERGKAPLFFEEERKKNGNENPWENSVFQYKYYQAEKPVREQTEAEGHAVRAVYLYSGMAAVAKDTGDESLWNACQTLWKNVSKKQMYVTGAIGASTYGESFTFDYDLPNDTMYGETCASIGMNFWSRRMLEICLDSQYADVMERSLYNGCLSGMSMDGTSFFYVNPLEINPVACKKDQGHRHVAVQRKKWFGCACCPPNLARMITSLGHYACTEKDDLLAFHLYVGGELHSEKSGVHVKVKSSLPWNGDVSIEVEESKASEVTLCFRIPGWCSGKYSISVNEQKAEGTIINGYYWIKREWVKGDCINICFNMDVQLQSANPHVKENIGKVAVTRGPIVYCLEEADQGKELHRVYLDRKSSFDLVRNDFADNVTDVLTEGWFLEDCEWNDRLYAADLMPHYEKCKLHFIPYYLWNNRGEGEMMVWLHAR